MCKVIALASNPQFQARQRERAYNLYVEGSKFDEDRATLDEAIDLYTKAITLDPSLAIAHTNLGNIHYRRGDMRKARECYVLALALDEDQPEAHYNLGYLALEDGEKETAVSWFKGALKLDPLFADAHFNIAQAYASRGDSRNVVHHYTEYLKLKPQGQWADVARSYIRNTPSPLAIVSKPRARARKQG